MNRTVYPNTKAIPRGPIKPAPGPFVPFELSFVAMDSSRYQEANETVLPRLGNSIDWHGTRDGVALIQFNSKL